LIEVCQLTKRYAGMRAVDDLSFQVRPGHVTGFVGPNGAGKSTTMRMILGLDAPASGEALVNGRRYVTLTRPLRQIGALLDAGAVHGGRSARDHLRCVARANGIGALRVDRLMDLVGLGEVARQRVGRFSLGMRQRLGIATALLGDPGILMFDEPLNGLDVDGIRWARGLLRNLAAEGRTVFVSSHLMSEMALTADHLIVIGRGRLIAAVRTEEFVRAGSGGDVLVRSPYGDDLARLLGERQAVVVTEPDGGLAVSGLDADAIGQIAADHRIPVRELVTRYASLEEAYLELTGESVDHRAVPRGHQVKGA
jgi:ABC-2 type transport system ATP-binding protein